MIADLLLGIALMGGSTPSSASCAMGPTHLADGTPRFWSSDRTCHSSRWFAGKHRVMIGFGCTAAPYYPANSACSGHRGFHHGIDIDMSIGTRVYSGVAGTVITGTLGHAYGDHAFIIRTAHFDVVLGHVGTVYVHNGERVKAGQLVARSNQLGAPDGPHLHFEVRPAGGDYRSAIDPRRVLFG